MKSTSELVRKAFAELYPGKPFPYQVTVKHSRKFGSYNANVRLSGNDLRFGLSREWKGVDADIVIGLLQALLIKLLGGKKTKRVELYHIFLKKVHQVVPKVHTDTVLSESFHRVNQEYFNDNMEEPNLKWSTDATRKLGHYAYGSDTILISSIFKDAPVELLDYIMYHELLHKKFKFDHKSERTVHHFREFREAERKYANFERMDAEISRFIAQKRRRRWRLLPW